MLVNTFLYLYMPGNFTFCPPTGVMQKLWFAICTLPALFPFRTILTLSPGMPSSRVSPLSLAYTDYLRINDDAKKKNVEDARTSSVGNGRFSKRTTWRNCAESAN